MSTHPNEKVKVLILSMELSHKKLTSKLSNTQHVYDGEYHIVAERVMDGYSNKTARQNAFTDAIIRHEIGHILTKTSDVKKVRKWLKLHSKKWWRENVSEYALKDAYEATAELFSLITSKTYEFGTLPRKMEALVLNMTSRA